MQKRGVSDNSLRFGDRFVCLWSQVDILFPQELAWVRFHRLLPEDLHDLAAVERVGASNNGFVGNVTLGEKKVGTFVLPLNRMVFVKFPCHTNRQDLPSLSILVPGPASCAQCCGHRSV